MTAPLKGALQNKLKYVSFSVLNNVCSSLVKQRDSCKYI